MPRGSYASSPIPESHRDQPSSGSGDAVIAVASTGAVTAMNMAAVSLLGSPAPHQFGLWLSQFIPSRYHRVIDAWSSREAGDARAAHPDPLTLSLSALRADGSEVRVLLTRRLLGDGPQAPYIVTMHELPTASGQHAPPVPWRTRHRPNPPTQGRGETAGR